MGWDENIYYNPEKLGLTPLGEIEWDNEAYQFNVTALWWRSSDECFFMADDAGCSCPTPFEGHTMESLERLVSLTSLKNYLRERTSRAIQWHPEREAALRDETGRLLAAAREKGMRL